MLNRKKFPITLSITSEDKGASEVKAANSIGPLHLTQPVYEKTKLTIIAKAKESNYVAALAINGESVPIEGKPEEMQKLRKVTAPVAITATYAPKEATVEEFTISFDTPPHGTITVADANGSPKVTINENNTIAAEFKEKQHPAVGEFVVTIAKAANGAIKVMNGKEVCKAGKSRQGQKARDRSYTQRRLHPRQDHLRE